MKFLISTLFLAVITLGSETSLASSTYFFDATATDRLAKVKDVVVFEVLTGDDVTEISKTFRIADGSMNKAILAGVKEAFSSKKCVSTKSFADFSENPRYGVSALAVMFSLAVQETEYNSAPVLIGALSVKFSEMSTEGHFSNLDASIPLSFPFLVSNDRATLLRNITDASRSLANQASPWICPDAAIQE